MSIPAATFPADPGSPRPLLTPRVAVLALAVLIAGSAGARAQVLIKVNEDVNFRLGVLGQFQADWLEDPAADDVTQNLFIRRVRVLFGGQVAKNVTFFVETDAPNLGRTLANGKNISPSVIVQDAYGEFKLNDAFALDAGLMFIPFSRNSIQTAASLLNIDYGTYTFAQSAATQSTVGRDAGFQAKGYFLDNRIEYRAGAFQGARDAPSHRSFRYAGRVQVQLLDPEAQTFFYPGTYLGRRKVMAVGAAFDTQSEYEAYDADVFFDYPLGPGGITAQFAYNRFDGGTTFTTLAEQDVVFAEAGYYISAWKLSPVFQFTRRAITDSDVGDETRWSVGANYWWAGHNANIKSAYTRIEPRGAATQNQFTIQLQVFYY